MLFDFIRLLSIVKLFGFFSFSIDWSLAVNSDSQCRSAHKLVCFLWGHIIVMKSHDEKSLKLIGFMKTIFECLYQYISGSNIVTYTQFSQHVETYS